MGKIISIPFTGDSFPTESKFASPQECINFYIQPYPEMGEKAMALYGTPGLLPWVTIPDSSEIRGTIVFGDYLFVVSGSKFYKVNKSGTASLIGELNTSYSGPVSMSTNGLDIVITDGVSGYIYTISSGSWSKISDVDFPVSSCIVFIDGYYLANETGTGRIWRSDWNDGSKWGELSFSTAGSNPDSVVSLIVDHKDVWVMGEITSEIWYNSGADTFNFDQIPGAFVEMGIVSPFSVTKINNALYWVGKDTSGIGHLMQAVGRQPKIISTYPVELSLVGCNMDNSIVFSYNQDGHSFVVFTFPDIKLTWVYDPTTGLWHKRSSRVDGVDREWRVGCHSVFNNSHIVGDRFSGKLYELRNDVYDEDGEPIISTRITPVIRKDQKSITIDRVQVINEPGVGKSSGNPEDMEPVGMFSWSRNGGLSWSAQIDLPLGKIGEIENRASVYQLGQGRNWVFKLVISSAIKKVIIGSIAEIELNE